MIAPAPLNWVWDWVECEVGELPPTLFDDEEVCIHHYTTLHYITLYIRLIRITALLGREGGAAQQRHAVDAWHPG
jgi:hypothetical protein